MSLRCFSCTELVQFVMCTFSKNIILIHNFLDGFTLAMYNPYGSILRTFLEQLKSFHISLYHLFDIHEALKIYCRISLHVFGIQNICFNIATSNTCLTLCWCQTTKSLTSSIQFKLVHCWQARTIHFCANFYANKNFSSQQW